MLSRLMSPPASPGRKMVDRDNPVLCPQALRRRWISVAAVWLGLALGWISGCGGSSQQALNAQLLAQTKPMETASELTRQLELHSSKTPPLDYKDYRVGPEDLLRVEIYGQEKLSREMRVNGRGEITMPLVGTVKVTDLTAQEIEQRLAELYGTQYIRNPQIMVEVKEFRRRRVSVTGAVAKPGTYELIGPRSLMEVLSLAGGFSVKPDAPAGDVVNVTRYQHVDGPSRETASGPPEKTALPPETMVINLQRLINTQSPDLNIMVQNGDVIHIPFARTAYVLGAVKKPGNVAVKENLTLSQAVALAGGIDPMLGTNSITVMRFDDQGNSTSISTNLKNIFSGSERDIPIKGNDVIVVSESPVKKTLFLIKQLLPSPSFPTY